MIDDHPFNFHRQFIISSSPFYDWWIVNPLGFKRLYCSNVCYVSTSNNLQMLLRVTNNVHVVLRATAE